MKIIIIIITTMLLLWYLIYLFTFWTIWKNSAGEINILKKCSELHGEYILQFNKKSKKDFLNEYKDFIETLSPKYEREWKKPIDWDCDDLLTEYKKYIK